MKRRTFLILPGLALAIATIPARAQAPLPPQTLGKQHRCPVCGMYPLQSPRWAAQVVFNDQTASFFDSPADLFRFLNAMPMFDKGHKPEDVGAVYITDFASGAWADARSAFFVTGSTARGPMKEPNLPAFSTRAAADAHARSEGGTVLAYKQITRDLLRSLLAGHQH